MGRRMRIFGCAVVLAISAMAATTARAASIVYTATATSDKEDWAVGLTVPKFDAELGVLLRASVEMRVTGDVHFSVTNTLDEGRFFMADYVYAANATIGGLDSSRFQWLTGGFGITSPLVAMAPPNSTTLFGPVSVPVSASDFYTSSADLAALTGPGLLNLFVGLTKNPGLRVGTTPGITYGLVDINRIVTFNVTYVYHTPEPSSMALAGIGVAGLLGASWRRRRRMAG